MFVFTLEVDCPLLLEDTTELLEDVVCELAFEFELETTFDCAELLDVEVESLFVFEVEFDVELFSEDEFPSDSVSELL